MLDSLLSILAPHECLACGRLGSLWCSDCRAAAPAAVERCYRCHALMPGSRTCRSCRSSTAIYSVQSATRYDGTAKDMLWKLKFGRAQAAASIAADMVATRLLLPTDAIITHVPTSTSHVRQRGYDQAALIAHRLARVQHRDHTALLRRLGKQQQHTATRRQRLTQLAGAFVVLRPDLVVGKHVVLVDDIITTGATLSAAAYILKEAGAKRVSAIVFAQA